VNNKNKAFNSDRRGSAAIIFSFAMVPVIAFVGSSIDYARR
jgi:Flp pilus assembly protein TadG